MSDGINELGKNLRKIDKEAKYDAKKASAEYPMGEIARDIFDYEVDYSMTFRTVRPGQSVAVNLQFELPPPSTGLGNCCGDCYCAMCDAYPADDEEYATTLLLKRPYVAGSVRLMLDDFWWQEGITETDPEAGIVTISSDIFDLRRDITVCYVYAYADCTTNIPPDPCAPYGSYLDDFDRASTFGNLPVYPTLHSSNMIGTAPMTTCLYETWTYQGGQAHVHLVGINDDPVWEGWYLDGDGNAVYTYNNAFNSFTDALDAHFENAEPPYILPYTGLNINCDTEIRWKTDHIPGDLVSEVDDGYFELTIEITDGGGNQYEWNMLVSSSGQTWSGRQKGIYFGPSQTNDYFGMNYWPFSWAADTWYIFKARTLMDGTCKWKMWVESDTEPDWFEESWDGPYPWTLEEIAAYNNEDYANAGNASPGQFSIEIDGGADESPAAGDSIPVEQYHISIDYIKMTDPT